MLISTESNSRDQLTHSMVLREIKLVNVESKTMFRLDNFNSYEL